MRLSVALPCHRTDAPEEFLRMEAVKQFARVAEEIGIDAIHVTDHPFPDVRWLEGGGHHALDPFVALGVVAAATQQITLHTNLLVLPYRNPFLAAKSVASLDRLSNGRVILGVGAGYLRREFEALGVGFDDRNQALDDAIDAMRDAWTGEPVQREGARYRARGNAMLPTTVNGSPPIWIGGNSLRAIERVARVGDGWSPAFTPPGSEKSLRTPALSSVRELEERLGVLRKAWADAGRTGPLDVVCNAPGFDLFTGQARPSVAQLVDGLGCLGEVGVTWTTLEVGGESFREALTNLEALGEAIPALHEIAPRSAGQIGGCAP